MPNEEVQVRKAIRALEKQEFSIFGDTQGSQPSSYFSVSRYKVQRRQQGNNSNARAPAIKSNSD
jgi:hypothetical protein